MYLNLVLQLHPHNLCLAGKFSGMWWCSLYNLDFDLLLKLVIKNRKCAKKRDFVHISIELLSFTSKCQILFSLEIIFSTHLFYNCAVHIVHC